MLQVALVMPIILFLALGRATRSGWRLQISLLFLAPFIATLLLLAGETAAFRDVGPILSPNDLVALVFSFCLLILPEGIYPSGVCISVLVLFAWVISEKIAPLQSLSQKRRLLIGVILGTALGALFAALVFAAYQSTQFVNFMASRDRIPPLTLAMSVLTGAIDGVLIAYYRRARSFDETADPRAQEAQQSPARTI